MYKRSIIFLAMWLPALLAGAQKNVLTGFPKGYTPEEVGRLIAYRMVYSKHALHAGKWIGYPETFFWTGALHYAQLTNDKLLLGFLEKDLSPCLPPKRSCCPL
ncbi:hypothetical protein LWM68_27370 [Niabella sp. W65]|nr:hypothetical protein [Niabella sp. W65]MCH7366164.1 hypothetical protein [Niabella sp. W65]ULT41894.1 hypothetical protein KRR40_46300 [Niabella sp. I65]